MLDEARWLKRELRIYFMEAHRPLHDRVKAAAGKWLEADIALEFLFVGERAGSDIRISFVPGDGSWSLLGQQSASAPEREATMNFGWLTDASTTEEIEPVVLHEFGHALGLIHEHQNPKGGYEWDEEAVIKDVRASQGWDEATIRHNILDHYDPAKLTATLLDTESIMMYPIPARWLKKGQPSGFNTRLSPTDITLIKAKYGIEALAGE